MFYKKLALSCLTFFNISLFCQNPASTEKTGFMSYVKDPVILSCAGAVCAIGALANKTIRSTLGYAVRSADKKFQEKCVTIGDVAKYGAFAGVAGYAAHQTGLIDAIAKDREALRWTKILSIPFAGYCLWSIYKFFTEPNGYQVAYRRFQASLVENNLIGQFPNLIGFAPRDIEKLNSYIVANNIEGVMSLRQKNLLAQANRLYSVFIEKAE